MQDDPAARFVTIAIALAALVLAALEVYLIVRGISYQPGNCYTEPATKRFALGYVGGPTLLLALGTAAGALVALRRGRAIVLSLAGWLGVAVCAFLVWGFLTIAAFGC